MAFERNRKSTNPNFGKKMTVADIRNHEILKLNKDALALLDEIDKKKFGLFRRKGDKV